MGNISDTLLGGLVGERAVVVEDFGDLPLINCPEIEAGLLANATAARKAEFSKGRRCAHEACRAIGRSASFIGCGEGGAPIWPNGVVGSITHTEGYVAAAVGPAESITYLGIDAEPAEPLPSELLATVLTESERDRLSGTSRHALFDRLTFCAKEAVFKALWPAHRIWLDFEHVEIEFRCEADIFHARIRSSYLPRILHGRFTITPNLLVVAVIC